MKKNYTKDDQRYSVRGLAVPVLLMTDDQAQPIPDPGSHHMDILTARNQPCQPLRPSFPYTLHPDTLLGVT